MCVCVCIYIYIRKYMLYKFYHGRKCTVKSSNLNLRHWLRVGLSPINSTLSRSWNIFSNASGMGAYYHSPTRNKFFLGSLTHRMLLHRAPAQSFNTLSLYAQSCLSSSSIPWGCQIREDFAPWVPTKAVGNQKGPMWYFFQNFAFQQGRVTQPWHCWHLGPTGCPVHCRVSSSTLGLYPVDASSISSCDN